MYFNHIRRRGIFPLISSFQATLNMIHFFKLKILLLAFKFERIIKAHAALAAQRKGML